MQISPVLIRVDIFEERVQGVHNIQYTTHNTQHTAHNRQQTAHSTQQTAHSTQQTAHNRQRCTSYSYIPKPILAKLGNPKGL